MFKLTLNLVGRSKFQYAPCDIAFRFSKRPRPALKEKREGGREREKERVPVHALLREHECE